ncbi:hypothetical protein PR048_006260 [Dryococelus australis]|uniref:Uncharacterized protein n=1 Tax=Dryococelus australis TaxID=614101 RepID=A0ABQ9IAG4_9NEOP|nr:hypothetical protein PR048_006260 [Dryococelus australis]
MKSKKEPVEEAVEENNMYRNLTVAFVGSWQKWGHTSLNGIVSATSVDTGKVTDIAILSKHYYKTRMCWTCTEANGYKIAIRQNTDSVEKMKGEESWCKYNRGKITGETYGHLHSLPFAIMEEIKPIFRGLSDINLLKKCLHGRTQNPNEYVNSVIWNRLPKTVFVQIRTLHFGVYDAVASFNKDNIAKCKVLEELGLSIGSLTADAILQIYLESLRQAEMRVKILHEKIRQARRSVKRKLESEMEEDIYDPIYGAGMH